MINKKGLAIRISMILLFILVFIGISSYALANLQIQNEEYYDERAKATVSNNTTIYASRGEIVDRNGVKLVSNTASYIIRLEKSGIVDETLNQMLLDLILVLERYDVYYFASLPIEIVDDEYVFSQNTDDLMAFLQKKLDGIDYTAVETMDFLTDLYEIDKSLEKSDILKIATLRYEMEIRNFSSFNNYILAENIPIDVITIIKERQSNFPGVYIDVKPTREYRTPYAAHILGRVGPFYSMEEYYEFEELGYSLNAIVGKDGMEQVLEPYLKETNGKQSQDLVVNGEIVSSGGYVAPIPGNNAVLTIDINLQRVAEESLEKTFEELKENSKKYGTSGGEVEGGAVVVLDVNTSEVLAIASYPTYSLETYGDDYTDLLNNPLNPLFNRAVQGIYAPGSVYKMITAIAGLEEGIVTPETYIYDYGRYTYYSGFAPACWYYNDYGASHGNVNVTSALKHSCNYYFYDVGRRLTAENLEKYTSMFGLGSKTGIELYEEDGIIAGPTYRAEIGSEWYPGDTLSAAIGQSDHTFTPTSIANYIAAIANGGTLNTVHLLKSVENHNYTETILENNPEPLSKIELNMDYLDAVRQGMSDVVNEGGTAARIFSGYPIQIAGKTGSAEIYNQDADGLFASYAPFENPEIAVVVVGEHAGSGGNVAAVARDIYDEYFGLN